MPFVVTLGIFFFLYPMLNEEKMEEIREQSAAEEGFGTQTDTHITSRNYDFLTVQLDLLMREQQSLRNSIDILRAEKEQLEHMIAELDEIAEEKMTHLSELPAQQREEQPSDESGPVAEQQPERVAMETVAEVIEEEQEPFADRVKSLLNLDEDELSPILVKMNNDQLVRLYRNAGNIQREKLLRSLNPDRAALLMESIML